MNGNLMIYKSDISEKNGFAIYQRRILKGTVYPLHWHDYFEFEIVVNGSGIHTYNNSIYNLSPGSAYLMSCSDFHALTAKTDIQLYGLHFEKTMLDERLCRVLGTSFGRFHCQLASDETAKILNHMQQLNSETETSLPYRDIMTKNIISEIVIRMIRKSTDCNPQPILPAAVKAAEIINDKFRSRLSLKVLAKELSFSPNYLGQLIKQQTGMTFNDYLNTIRLKYACNLLTKSDMPVKEITYESGYSSVEYFMYIFKNKIGITPGEYRKQNKDIY